MIPKIAIIDDNPKDLDLASKIIQDYCESKSFQIELIKSTEPHEINFKAKNLAALFLDIEMPEINGIDLAREISEQNPYIKIIFVTNMDHLVYDASRVAPFGFVRKSKLKDEIYEVIDRLIKKYSKQYDFILIQNSDVIYKMHINDILWISVYQNDIEIHTFEQIIKSRMTLKSFMSLIPHDFFLKINRSFIININHVEELHANSVIMADGAEIFINSRSLRSTKETIIKYIQGNSL